MRMAHNTLDSLYLIDGVASKMGPDDCIPDKLVCGRICTAGTGPVYFHIEVGDALYRIC